ncbi:hypothetical protein NP493_217g04018 [Ridgeia piscesae]|uniref:glutathione transferase n=1 Tax=Ridgeia piscesae TaxID=27915 RepID=A0AAD9P0J2_RIDPI|nr:hypothetical protein NP493_217g04018 [Ridgeia piscesae]
MAALKLYFDPMSQPSRAVLLFLKANSIPFIEKQITLRKGEHLTEEFLRINPFHKVPVIDDNGFILTESVAILKYLCGSRHMPEHWYPVDVCRRARVDEFFGWQHTNLWLPSSLLFRTKYIEPRLKNIPVDLEKLHRAKVSMDQTLDQLENVFLRRQDYLCGDDISIADVHAICVLMQADAAGHDLITGRPRVADWIGRVKLRLQPHFDDVHSTLYAVREKFARTQANL